MKKIRALIVDDEPPACRRIKRMLQSEPDIEVIGMVHSGRDAVHAIESDRPDLIFLDVQMPDFSGFEVIASLAGLDLPALIFVTAHDEFAIRAFEVHAMDYLLKPFERPRLIEALQHARKFLQSGSHDLQRVIGLLRDFQASHLYIDHLPIKTNERIALLKVEEIDWIEAQGKYVAIHAARNVHRSRTSMQQLENDLDPVRFVRIHRKAIVNIDRIQELQPWFHGDYKVILKTGKQLMLSRHYKTAIQRLLWK